MLTSAINGMSIADMRKYLIVIRTSFFEHSKPFDINALLFPGKKVWQFSLDVVTGLHSKRTVAVRRLHVPKEE